MVAGLKQFRIVGINDEIDVDGLEELYNRGINGIWMVEPSSCGSSGKLCKKLRPQVSKRGALRYTARRRDLSTARRVGFSSVLVPDQEQPLERQVQARAAIDRLDHRIRFRVARLSRSPSPRLVPVLDRHCERQVARVDH